MSPPTRTNQVSEGTLLTVVPRSVLPRATPGHHCPSLPANDSTVGPPIPLISHPRAQMTPYRWIWAKAILYVGRCTGERKGKGTLADRFNAGYGNISPRNCFENGQSTNCRINNLVLYLCKEKYSIELVFHRTPNGDSASRVEADILNKTRPPWNRNVPSYATPSSGQPVGSEPKAAERETGRRQTGGLTEVVRQEVIDHWFTPARSRGEREVTVTAREVNRQLRWSQRYPSICSALSDRSGELSQRANVELIRSTCPNPSSTTEFVYRLL